MERRQAMLRRARVLGQVNDITLQLGELSAWLDANRSGGTKQKLLNRSAKCGDLVYDANQLDLSEEQKKALVADIEAVEARYSHAIRNPGGVCTPTHKEAHDDQ